MPTVSVFKFHEIQAFETYIFFSGTNTEKYKAAKNSKTIQCVPIEWIKDSISSGFSLPQDNYSLKRSTSTPTRDNEGPNFSMISVIAPSHSKTQLEFYNETINNTNCLLQTTTSKKRKSMCQMIK